jgi:hypothetical protein
MKRPSEKDEEFEPQLADPAARARVETLTQRLLSFAETTSKEEDNRRYFFARGHEFAAIIIDHGKPLLDVRAPRPGMRTEGGSALKERMRAGAHREGWVLVPIETDDDIRAAEQLAGLGYEEVFGTAPAIAVRKERPLESFTSGAGEAKGKQKAGANKSGKIAGKKSR